MVEIDGNIVTFHGTRFEGEHPVSQAREAGDIVLILYQHHGRKWGQFQNLIAVDGSGRELWKAELPTSDSMDSYYKIVSECPIVAYSVCSYECTIDAATGRIVKKVFFK